MGPKIRIVGSAGIALAVLLVALTGSAAAVSMDQEATLSNYSDAPVVVKNAPDMGWDNEGYVQVDLSGAAINDGNVTLVGETGTTLSDLEPSTDSIYVGDVNKTQINNSGGSFSVDVQVDGTVETTVTVEIGESDAIKSQTNITGSEIRNASSINVTVDSDAFTDTDDLSRLQSDDDYRLAFHADGFRFVVEDFDPQSINGTTTVDLTNRTLTVNKISNVTDGEKHIFAPESVEMIEVDGEVLYEQSAIGTTSGSGSNRMLLIGAALAAAALLVARE